MSAVISKSASWVKILAYYHIHMKKQSLTCILNLNSAPELHVGETRYKY